VRVETQRNLLFNDSPSGRDRGENIASDTVISLPPDKLSLQSFTKPDFPSFGFHFSDAEPKPLEWTEVAWRLGGSLVTAVAAEYLISGGQKDKMLHAAVGASLSTGVGLLLNNPLYGLASGVGAGALKEAVDGSALNPKGTRDWNDFWATGRGSLIGAAWSWRLP